MSQFADLSFAAESIQVIILHNQLTQKGDPDEEQYQKLFGNIQDHWAYLRQFLSSKSQDACDDILKGLHVNYEGNKNLALMLFGNIANDPRTHVRSDLIVSRR